LRHYGKHCCEAEIWRIPLTLPAEHQEVLLPPLRPRKDAGSLGYATIILLSLVIVVNVVGAFVVLTAGPEVGLAAAVVNVMWVMATGVTGIFFLAWLCRARMTAASYGPGCVGAYRTWTVAGWLCPVVNLWVPYRILADVLRASDRPDPDALPILAAPPRHPAGVTALRGWCVAWHGMWLVLLSAVVDNGITASAWLPDLAFQLLSIAAAVSAIAVITTVTRGQDRRASDPYFRPVRFPQAAPAWFWPAAVVVFVGLVTVAPHMSGHLTAFKDLFVP
jgi:hypothetical protein